MTDGTTAVLCEMVTRQTDYDEDTALAKLKEFDMDVEAVVRDYLGPAPRTRSPRKSLNQRIYREIRGFMDTTGEGAKHAQERADASGATDDGGTKEGGK
jgi:hypothetical protein